MLIMSATHLLTINSPTLKSVAMSLYDIIHGLVWDIVFYLCILRLVLGSTSFPAKLESWMDNVQMTCQWLQVPAYLHNGFPCHCESEAQTVSVHDNHLDCSQWAQWFGRVIGSSPNTYGVFLHAELIQVYSKGL